MEEEAWLSAAQHVLMLSQNPMHYTDIKKTIHEQGLVSPSLKTTLEEALFKEIQRPGGRFKSIVDEPGVFGLVNTDGGAEEIPPHVKKILPTAVKPKMKIGAGAKIIAVATKQGVKYTTGTTIMKPTPVMRPAAPSANDNTAVQEKYKSKYKRLRKQIKDLIFINAAVCDEVIAMEERVQKVKDQRRYLLTRLLQHQAVSDTLHPPSTPGSTASTPGPSTKPSTQSIAQILGEVDKRKKKAQPAGGAPGTAVTPGGGKRKAAAMAKDATDEASAKLPKPKKPRTGPSGRRLVHPLPLDSVGRPMLPIDLGTLTVYCLGEILSDRANFHSPEYIYPAGYCSTREYASVHTPEERSLYTCKITDTRHGPKFDVSPEDAPDMVFSGYTASDCHLKLLKAINHGRPTELVPLEPRGEEFFGLSHPTVQSLIQSCPGAKKCAAYKWVRFEISKVPLASFDSEDVTVNVDMLHKLPVFAGKTAAESLRNLLTTAAGGGTAGDL